MKLSPHHPFLPKSQCPVSQTLWVSAEEEGSHLLGAQPTRRQSGGAMGWAEGEGEKKAKQGFLVFFFFTSFTGRGICRRGVPFRATFWGPRVPRCPFPFLSWTLVLPAPKRALTLPKVKRQGSQVVGRGLMCPFLRGPGLACLRETGTSGIPAVQGLARG